MKPAIALRSILILFVAVIALYFAAFHGMEYFRHRKGAWEVQFQTDAMGRPSVVISQRTLQINSVQIQLPDERLFHTNLSETVVFDLPEKPVPFGKVIYEDLTILPGVVTFDLFGHEVELIPRVLVLNKKQVPWQSGQRLELAVSEKPASPPVPPKGHVTRSP